MSIYHLSVITRDYKSARQELLVSIFNSSVIAYEQCVPCVAQAQHISYLQNFSRYKGLHTFFSKLGRELYRMYICMFLSNKLTFLKWQILQPDR